MFMTAGMGMGQCPHGQQCTDGLCADRSNGCCRHTAAKKSHQNHITGHIDDAGNKQNIKWTLTVTKSTKNACSHIIQCQSP